MRRSLWLSMVVAAAVLLATHSARAQLRDYQLGFRPPLDTRVVGFHVYLASAPGGYASYRDDINFVPPVDSSGVASYALTGLEQFSDVFISLRSYDASGTESPFSNEIKLAAVQQCLVTGCNDSNPCTADSCTASGCVFDPAARTGQSCDDGDPATTADTCRSGVCAGVQCTSDAQCSDGQDCNGVERCVSNACVAGTPMVCSDGNTCNGAETCVGSSCVSGTALACPADSGPCFDSFCDPVLGCSVQLHPDGTACTTSTTASAGTCSAGVCVATTTTSTCSKRWSWWCTRKRR